MGEALVALMRSTLAIGSAAVLPKDAAKLIAPRRGGIARLDALRSQHGDASRGCALDRLAELHTAWGRTVRHAASR